MHTVPHGRKIRFSAVLLLATALLAFGLQRSGTQAVLAAAPAISSISPTFGPTGTLVTITGSNFVAGSTNANFGGAAPVAATCSSASVCTANAPAQAPGTPATVLVSVTVAGNGTSNSTSFTYAPTITAVLPNTAAAGSTVEIDGTGFIPGGTTVTFGSAGSVSAQCSSPTQCTATVPALPQNTTVVSVTVTTIAGTSPGGVLFTYQIPAPILYGISPSNGTFGTQVTLNGANFVVGQTNVSFEGSPLVPASCTSTTTCTVFAPSLAAGTAAHVVVFASNQTSTQTVIFTYQAVPVLNPAGGSPPGMIPNAGPAGTLVTFNGANFIVGSATANFGGVNTTANCSSTTLCTANAPSQPAGTTAVQVNLLIGAFTTNSLTFTYTSSNNQAITVSPNFGSAGTPVTITGNGFQTGSATAVFGGSTSPATCSSSTTCTTTAPSQPAGVTSVVVYLQFNGSTSGQASFTYNTVANGFTISPPSGPAGTAVTFFGSGFAVGQGTATFGGVTAIANCSTTTSCTATAPAQAAGTTTVTVTLVTGGVTNGSAAFTYSTGGSGTISPTSGPAGTVVTFFGSGYPAGGTLTAFFGTISVTASCATTTECTATAPAQASGTSSVPVYLVLNGTQVNQATFTYSSSSSITIASLSPTSGAANSTVTATGSGFVPGGTVFNFGSNSASNVSCASTTSCTMTVPTGSGTVNVVAYVNGAQSNSVQFTYSGSTGTLSLNPIGPFQGAPGQSISFVASGSGLPADTVYSWNFGDGSSGSGQSVTHTYSAAGSYTVTLTATSASTGGSGSVSGQAIIGSQLSVSISGPSTAGVGQSVSFTATVSGTVPAGATFNWNFGDGSTGGGQTVSHTFTAAGTYQVTVTISGSNATSLSNTASLSVTIGSGNSGSGSQSVTYQMGWNLVAGPASTMFPQAQGGLYTYQAGDTQYEQQPGTQGIIGAEGYWAYFIAPTATLLTGTSPALPVTINAPAGQFIMVGDPSATLPVTVTGADVVYTFSPSSNSYSAGSATATLQPGQGAWVYSAAGAVITLR